MLVTAPRSSKSYRDLFLRPRKPLVSPTSPAYDGVAVQRRRRPLTRHARHDVDLSITIPHRPTTSRLQPRRPPQHQSPLCMPRDAAGRFLHLDTLLLWLWQLEARPKALWRPWRLFLWQMLLRARLWRAGMHEGNATSTLHCHEQVPRTWPTHRQVPRSCGRVPAASSLRCRRHSRCTLAGGTSGRGSVMEWRIAPVVQI